MTTTATSSASTTRPPQRRRQQMEPFQRGLGRRPCANQPLSATRAIDKLARESDAAARAHPAGVGVQRLPADAAAATYNTRLYVKYVYDERVCARVRACNVARK